MRLPDPGNCRHVVILAEFIAFLTKLDSILLLPSLYFEPSALKTKQTHAACFGTPTDQIDPKQRGRNHVSNIQDRSQNCGCIYCRFAVRSGGQAQRVVAGNTEERQPDRNCRYGCDAFGYSGDRYTQRSVWPSLRIESGRFRWQPTQIRGYCPRSCWDEERSTFPMTSQKT